MIAYLKIAGIKMWWVLVKGLVDAGIMLVWSTVARIIDKTTNVSRYADCCSFLSARMIIVVPYRKRINFMWHEIILEEILTLVLNAP